MTETRPPTEAEERFVGLLLGRLPELQDWYHQDADGTRWLMVSHDFVRPGGGVAATLRLDYDGTELLGGWSPACLNWDADVRASSANIDTTPPDGLALQVDSPEHAFELAVAWFEAHRARWATRD